MKSKIKIVLKSKKLGRKKVNVDSMSRQMKKRKIPVNKEVVKEVEPV